MKQCSKWFCRCWRKFSPGVTTGKKACLPVGEGMGRKKKVLAGKKIASGAVWLSDVAQNERRVKSEMSTRFLCVLFVVVGKICLRRVVRILFSYTRCYISL